MKKATRLDQGSQEKERQKKSVGEQRHVSSTSAAPFSSDDPYFYALEGGKLTLSDGEENLSIEEPFEPLRVPHPLPIDLLNGTSDHKAYYDAELTVDRGEGGKILRAYFLKGGVMEGELMWYFPVLPLSCRGRAFYKGGQLHGFSESYTMKGECVAQSWFYRGKKEGKAYMWYPADSPGLASSPFPEEGEPSQQLYSLERYQGGLKEGEQCFFYPDGTPRMTMTYHKGVVEGDVVLFWSEGKKKREGTFHQGKKEGLHRFWNDKGVLTEEGSFEKGRAIGTHRRWHHRGTLIEEKRYEEEFCAYKTFDEDSGALVSEGTYPLDAKREED